MGKRHCDICNKHRPRTPNAIIVGSFKAPLGNKVFLKSCYDCKEKLDGNILPKETIELVSRRIFNRMKTNLERK